MIIGVYIASIIAIGTFMPHFWTVHPASSVLWIIAGASAIASVYGGIIGRAKVENEHHKAILKASTVIGCLVLLGLTLSALLIFVPAMS